MTIDLNIHPRKSVADDNKNNNNVTYCCRKNEFVCIHKHRVHTPGVLHSGPNKTVVIHNTINIVSV